MGILSFRKKKTEYSEIELAGKYKKLTDEQHTVVDAYKKARQEALDKEWPLNQVLAFALAHAKIIAVGFYKMKDCKFLDPWLLDNTSRYNKLELDFQQLNLKQDAQLEFMNSIVEEQLRFVSGSGPYANEINQLSISIPYALDKNSAEQLSKHLEAFFLNPPKCLHSVEIKLSKNNNQALSDKAIQAILAAPYKRAKDNNPLKVSLEYIYFTPEQEDQAKKYAPQGQKHAEETAFARQGGLTHKNCLLKRNSGGDLVNNLDETGTHCSETSPKQRY